MSQEKKTFTFGSGLKNSVWNNQNKQQPSPQSFAPPKSSNPFLKSTINKTNMSDEKTNIQFNGINDEKVPHKFGGGLGKSVWGDQNNRQSATPNAEPQKQSNMFTTSNSNKTDMNEKKKTFMFGSGLKNSIWSTKNNQETAPTSSEPPQPNKSLFSTNNKTSPFSSQIDDKKPSIAGNIKQEQNNPFLKSESTNKASSTFGKPKYNAIPPPSDQHFTTESSLKQEPSKDLQYTEKSIKKEEKIQAKESPKPTEKLDLQFKDKVENPPSTFDSKPKHLPQETQQNTSLPKPSSEASLNSNSSHTENQPANEVNEFNEKCTMKVKTHGLPIPFVIKFYEMICRVNPDYEWNDIDKDLEELATTVIH